FLFNDAATTVIYTLSLHDALPICLRQRTIYLLTLLSPMSMPSLSSSPWMRGAPQPGFSRHILRIRSRTSLEMTGRPGFPQRTFRSEEHTSELQSRENLVCRLLLEK